MSKPPDEQDDCYLFSAGRLRYIYTLTPLLYPDWMLLRVGLGGWHRIFAQVDFVVFFLKLELVGLYSVKSTCSPTSLIS